VVDRDDVIDTRVEVVFEVLSKYVLLVPDEQRHDELHSRRQANEATVGASVD
jgi:hypothetical protein